MADPANIEDVLSAIRRLVSDGTRDRLVLTADLRVPEERAAAREVLPPLVLTRSDPPEAPSEAILADAGSLEARIAQLEAVVAAQNHKQSGHNQGADDTGAIPPAGEAEVAGRGYTAMAAPQGVALDDAALRGVVAGLVREELQGVMGERITRNMRRLVRREIMRAIAAGDLD